MVKAGIPGAALAPASVSLWVTIPEKEAYNLVSCMFFDAVSLLAFACARPVFPEI
ncbi:hypothetical protein D3C85_1582460 [compost metagenome]